MPTLRIGSVIRRGFLVFRCVLLMQKQSSTLPGVQPDQDINAWGIGTRFLALEEKNVWVGLDLARGPEEDAYYI